MEVSNHVPYHEADTDMRTNPSDPAEDTFLSPYSSPQKEFFTSEVNNGSGDFNNDCIKRDTENDHSIANYVYSAADEDTEAKRTGLENHVVISWQVISENSEKSADLQQENGLQFPHNESDSGIAVMTDGAVNELKKHNDVQEPDDSQDFSRGDMESILAKKAQLIDPTSVPSPEEKKEKIIEEMLASATDSPNAELSHSEMVSISKKMEEEFRTMVLEEQQKKKISIEGPSYAANTNLSGGDLGHIDKGPTNKELAAVEVSDGMLGLAVSVLNALDNSQSSKGFTSLPSKTSKATKSRLPTSQSRTSRPNSARNTPKTTAQTGVSLASIRSTNLTTKHHGTPTTIRVTPKTALSTQSPREQRTPLHLSATQIKPGYRKANSSRTSNVTPTPIKATQPTSLRSPRSATSPRSPFVTPRRPPSAQSSDSGRGRMPTPRNVPSKIGSLQNAKHTPGGGNVKIESKKADYSHVASKVGSKTNINHTPSGGQVRIESKKLDYSAVGSRCGSLANTSHTPGGGKVKIESRKVNYSHVGSKCGSMGNITHTPGGGRVRVENRKLDFSGVSSKCGSKDNLKHTPHGGNVKPIAYRRSDFRRVASKIGSLENISYSPSVRKVKIFHEKTNFTNVSGRIGSMDNLGHSPGGGKVKIFHAKIDTSKVQSKVGSKDNLKHTPGGGKVKILNRSIDLSHVKSKCGSMDNTDHVAGGGNVRIFDEAITFKDNAKAKVGSLDNADHVPGGGDVQIYDEKLYYREVGAARTDNGFNGLGSQGSSGSISPM